MALKVDSEKANEVKERLRSKAARYRKARGLSVRALADELGVSPSHVHFIENGQRFPSMEVVYAYARVMRKRASSLLFAR